jgi:hypothetical protein
MANEVKKSDLVLPEIKPAVEQKKLNSQFRNNTNQMGGQQKGV